ncbi:MAG: hypothetical protein SFZ02_19685 [bacterium]|nr:hypothetical protein [bacterium]
MKTTLRFFTIGMLSLLVFGMATSTQPALACSGGQPSSISELISYADVIVRGHIVERDDSGQNAIMEVTEYLKGEGNEFILLGINNPASILNNRLRHSGGGCFYGISRLPENREIIIFLNKDFDGSYTLGDGHYSNEDYYSEQPTIRIWEDLFGIRRYRDVTFDNFISIIQRIVGIAPTLPMMNNSYPLRAPMVITTELGIKYILPIDESPPILPSELGLYELHLASFLEWLGNSPTNCWTIGCHGRASSILDRAQITTEGVVIEYPGAPFSGGYTKGGRGFAFSPTNEGVVAVWAEADIGILTNRGTFDNEIIIQIRRYEHPFMGFPIISERHIEANRVYWHGGAWSPHARFLAFSDDTGIRLWDMFANITEEPRLILETPIKAIQGFSPMGNYLVIGDKEAGLSLHIASGNTYPAGVFSPNDRVLIPYGDTFQVIYFTPLHEVASIQALDMPVELLGYTTEKIVWASENTVYRLACQQLDSEKSCFVVGADISRGVYTPHPLIEAINFDYDSANAQLVILHKNSQITISTSHFTKQYDLSAYLDSPIASIEWLSSLFFYDS